MLGIVVSRADEASVHIGERLRALADWSTREDGGQPDGEGGGTVHRLRGVELRTFDELHIALEGAADAFDAVDCLAFASRHAGETGPLLTTHATGNVGPAEYGGEADALAMAAPGAMAAVLASFEAHAPTGYDVSLECTHHGPTDLDVPSLFVEVGSDEPQWRDPAAAEAAARAILSLRDVDPVGARTLAGFGGGHYAPRFTRIARETDWAVGHIAADWGLRAMGELDPALVEAAFVRSGAERAVIDGDRPELEALVASLGYRVVSETWVRETAGEIPLALVEEIEATLGTVDEGVRFGAAARDAASSGECSVVEPAPTLLEDVVGLDAARVRSLLADEAVAWQTVEAGNRPAGRVAVPSETAWARIESGLVDLLRERFGSVVVEDDAIVVTERVFDPDRARALGVEPGPSFGRLAEGEPVTVDGQEVEPEAVHVSRTRRYPR